MADFSISWTKDQLHTISAHDGTEGTLAPGAGQVEIRIDLTTVPVTRRDILAALDKAETYFRNLGETGSGADILGLQP